MKISTCPPLCRITVLWSFICSPLPTPFKFGVLQCCLDCCCVEQEKENKQNRTPKDLTTKKQNKAAKKIKHTQKIRPNSPTPVFLFKTYLFYMLSPSISHLYIFTLASGCERECGGKTTTATTINSLIVFTSVFFSFTSCLFLSF